jgi:hypothetical protein
VTLLAFRTFARKCQVLDMSKQSDMVRIVSGVLAPARERSGFDLGGTQGDCNNVVTSPVLCMVQVCLMLCTLHNESPPGNWPNCPVHYTADRQLPACQL